MFFGRRNSASSKPHTHLQPRGGKAVVVHACVCFSVFKIEHIHFNEAFITMKMHFIFPNLRVLYTVLVCGCVCELFSFFLGVAE